MPYRTDATNTDTALTRNFIRAEVVPKLCRVNAQAVEHIGETALRLRQEDEYLDSLAAAYLTELKTEAGAVTLPCAAVTQAPAVLKPRVLRLALDALGAGKKDFTAAHYDALAALCAGSGTAQLDLPGGVTARRADGVFAYTQGYGYPTVQTVTQELFSDPSGAADKVFSADVDKDAIPAMLDPVVTDSNVTIDGVSRSMTESTVYATAKTEEGGSVQYRISMVRDGITWKVSNVELYFPSQA